MFVVSLKALMNSVATLTRYPELAIRALRYRPSGVRPRERYRPLGVRPRESRDIQPRGTMWERIVLRIVDAVTSNQNNNWQFTKAVLRV